MGQPDRTRLCVQRQGWSRGLRAPVLGEGLISSGRGFFKGRRGRQDSGHGCCGALGARQGQTSDSRVDGAA